MGAIYLTHLAGEPFDLSARRCLMANMGPGCLGMGFRAKRFPPPSRLAHEAMPRPAAQRLWPNDGHIRSGHGPGRIEVGVPQLVPLQRIGCSALQDHHHAFFSKRRFIVEDDRLVAILQ